MGFSASTTRQQGSTPYGLRSMMWERGGSGGAREIPPGRNTKRTEGLYSEVREADLFSEAKEKKPAVLRKENSVSQRTGTSMSRPLWLVKNSLYFQFYEFSVLLSCSIFRKRSGVTTWVLEWLKSFTLQVTR